MQLSQLLSSMNLEGRWCKADIVSLAYNLRHAHSNRALRRLEKGKRRASAGIDVNCGGHARRLHVRLLRQRGLDLLTKPIAVLKLHRERRRTAALRLSALAGYSRAGAPGTIPDHQRRVPRRHLHAPRGVLGIPASAPNVCHQLQRHRARLGAARAKAG